MAVALVVAVVCFIIAASLAYLSAGYSQEVIIDNNVTMKTRDSVVLRADVYRPKAEGKFPVILERTPYDKRSEVSFE